MWNVNGQDLKMCEGDWGIQLPIKISGTTLAAADEIKLTVKTAVNGDVVLEKTFADIQNNTVNFELTEDETELLSVGTYYYALDWYQDGAFMCNIIPASLYKVVEKV